MSSTSSKKYRHAFVMRGRVIHLLLAWGVFLTATAVRAETKTDMVYVKKASREETKEATLEASGYAGWSPRWHIIGPFDNTDGKGFSAVYPPEQELDLEATYEGKGGEVRWKKARFRDGIVYSLNRFGQSDDCVCYLYRQIESDQAKEVRVSLGSDDGIVVWLNGEKLLARDVSRAAAADQDFVTLDLKEGTNDLLLKVTNRGSNWQFYFNPTISDRFMVKLQRQLDSDFPPLGEALHYRMYALPLPEDEMIEVGGLAFAPDGRLFVGTRRGDVFVVDEPLAEDPDRIHLKPYLRGLHEILGLQTNGNEELLVGQRPEVTLVRDEDHNLMADTFLTVCDKFGISGNYHEYLYGPVRDAEGNLFISLNCAFGGGHSSRVPYRGWMIKIQPDGQMIPWAYGLRSPNGLNFSPDGRLFYADNQGEWIPTCKLQEVRQNEFYGHVASVPWAPGGDEENPPEMIPPAIWFPFLVCRSASEMVWDTSGGKFGPFEGQCFVGELTNSLIMRCDLEEVQGRMQGACFIFRKGFHCGVNRLEFASDGSLFVGETNRGWGSIGGRTQGVERLEYSGVVPFEIKTLRVTPDGWELTLTKPARVELAKELKRYVLRSYTYHYWSTYGSPEIEQRSNDISSVDVSDDGLTIRLTVPQREVGRVFQFKFSGINSQDGDPLLHSQAWYTLNALPEDESSE